MAREVRIEIWCDACLADGTNREGEELPPLPVDGRPRVVALCPPHHKELYEPLSQLLAEHGQPVSDGVAAGAKHVYASTSKAATPVPGGLPCPAPGCVSVLRNDQSLKAHCRSQHKKTHAELLGEATPFVCPECGRAFPRVQSMAVHRRRAHDVAGAS